MLKKNTGMIEEVLPNGMAKLQTNRNHLYSPCSSSMCQDNVVIDAVNTIGAVKGQYVEYTIPDNHMVTGAVLCFGLPLFLVLLCTFIGYFAGANLGYDGQSGAIAGFCAGIPVAVVAIKTYDKVVKPDGSEKIEIIRVVE
ncbi:SoxR reducing system RseC family protein [Megasphaera vaginalis (ex Bordigoni et al. 2020)]|uniref:SoxR reducing system RseC family protein n=1 Tax=Megasphaera vaginalis (ex Bordigoni et al. 2020) TaxID=2045301 RepID=UPI000C79CCFA|nr:SoxR reducing system RseC family protein [Megasphaera vaginalis (ex Bordigoni et al. 2020)]